MICSLSVGRVVCIAATIFGLMLILSGILMVWYGVRHEPSEWVVNGIFFFFFGFVPILLVRILKKLGMCD
ncbi:MAG: hypothetical protein ACE5JU_22765 [Candidatus Binatia bacterium]